MGLVVGGEDVVKVLREPGFGLRIEDRPGNYIANGLHQRSTVGTRFRHQFMSERE